MTGHRGAKGRRGAAPQARSATAVPGLRRPSEQDQATNVSPALNAKNARQQRGKCAAGYILHSFSFVTHSGATSILRPRSAEVFLHAAGGKKGKKSLCNRRQGGIVQKLSTWQTL